MGMGVRSFHGRKDGMIVCKPPKKIAKLIKKSGLNFKWYDPQPFCCQHYRSRTDARKAAIAFISQRQDEMILNTTGIRFNQFSFVPKNLKAYTKNGITTYEPEPNNFGWLVEALTEGYPDEK
jgi:hypothetical protein